MRTGFSRRAWDGRWAALREKRPGLTTSPITAGQSWLPAVRPYIAMVVIGNLVWEVAQLPLYTIWRTGTFGENAFAVIHCTIGDVALALAILAVALLVAGDRDWPARSFWPVAILTVLLGAGSTIVLEWLNVVVWKSWAYSTLMPVLPVLGFRIGFSPLLQWIFVPLLALWYARTARQCRAM